MCGEAALRRELIALPGLMVAAVDAWCGGITSSTSKTSAPRPSPAPSAAAPGMDAAASDVQLAASTLVYNASIEPEAQRTLLAVGLAVPHVLRLTAHSDLRMASRAAAVVSRCCRHSLRDERLLMIPAAAGGAAETSAGIQGAGDAPAMPSGADGHANASPAAGGSVCKALVDLLRRCCEPAAVVAAAEGTTASSLAIAEARWSAIDATSRALALLTHDEGPSGSLCIAELLCLGAVDMLLWAIRLQFSDNAAGSQGASAASSKGAPTSSSATVRESILGNAALCLGHLARSDPSALKV